MAYTTTGVRFDGTNDYMVRGGALTSAVDSQKGLVSFWVRMMGGDGNFQQIWEDSDGGNNQISRFNSNKLYMQFSSTGGVSHAFQLTSTTSFVNGDGWRHVLFTWDSSGTAYAQFYLNDVAEGTPAFSGGTTVDWTKTDFGFANRLTGNLLCNMEIADFYFNTDESLDLSIATNRRRFISASGGVVNLGSTGQLPTGTSPRIFFKGPQSGFPTNLGTGGGYTLTGTLVDSATDPPADATDGIQFIPSGSTAAAAANGANVTLTVSGLLQNDVIVVIGGIGGATAATQGATGNNSGAFQTLHTSDVTNVQAYVGWQRMGATPDTSITCVGNADTQHSAAYACLAFRNVSTDTPPTDATTTTSNAVSGDPNAPSITWTTAGTVVITGAIASLGDATVVAPAGYAKATTFTATANDNTSATVGIVYKLVTASPEDPGAWTTWGGSAQYVAATVALKPLGVAAAGQPTIARMGGVERASSLSPYGEYSKSIKVW